MPQPLWPGFEGRKWTIQDIEWNGNKVTASATRLSRDRRSPPGDTLQWARAETGSGRSARCRSPWMDAARAADPGRDKGSFEINLEGSGVAQP